MNNKRFYFFLLGIIGVLCTLLIASAVFGQKLMNSQSAKLMNLKLDNQLLDQQQTALGKANSDLLQYAELGILAKTIVPQDKDQAKTIREILNIADENDIPLTAISFPASTLGAPVVATPSSGTTTPVNTTPPLSQVKPVVGVTGVYKMEITVQSDQTNPRPYANLQNFLAKLEQNRRTSQVSQLVITPNPKDIKLLSFSLTINVFIKP